MYVPEQQLAGAHAAMRHAQPKHNPGSQARHTPKRQQTLGPQGTPRRGTPLRHEEPRRPNPSGALTAPPRPTVASARANHLQPGHLGSTALSGAVNPLSMGRPIPAGTAFIPSGEQLPPPANHRQAIFHPATSAELMARNRERG